MNTLYAIRDRNSGLFVHTDYVSYNYTHHCLLSIPALYSYIPTDLPSEKELTVPDCDLEVVEIEYTIKPLL